MLRPILPYPGGKWRLREPILARLSRYHGWEQFREPFAGGGAVSIAMLVFKAPPIWINDMDTGIYSLWKSLRDHPDLLRRRIHNFVPSIAAFDQLKAYLRTAPIGACDHDIVHIGFCKLALHCLSHSAIGLNAGPKGGYSGCQIGKRWSPRYLCGNITRLQHCIQHIRITAMDYRTLIADETAPALLYLDPPYHSTGAGLYSHTFADFQDHVGLAQALRRTPHPWVLSYDNCAQIRHLYQDWAYIEFLPVKYTIRGGSQVTELLISSQ
jgi:DNA adenine methylase